MEVGDHLHIDRYTAALQKATKSLARSKSDEEAQARREREHKRETCFLMYTNAARKVGVALTQNELDEHLTAAAGHALAEQQVKTQWEQAEPYNGQDHEREKHPAQEDSIDGEEAEEDDFLYPVES